MTPESVVNALDGKGELVHIKNIVAYEALRDGKLVFDEDPEAERLKAFHQANVSEFGAALVIRDYTVDGMHITVLYHHHAAQERIYKSNIMKAVLEDNPALGGV
jgi:spore maturation protein CgeB